LFIATLLAGTPAFGQEADEGLLIEEMFEQDKFLDEAAEGGIIVNQTMTSTGFRFYQNFLDCWREQKRSLDGNLVIYERPSARWGDLVWIEYKQKILLRFFLNSRSDIKSTGENAARYVADRLLDLEIERMFTDQDIDTDEL